MSLRVAFKTSFIENLNKIKNFKRDGGQLPEVIVSREVSSVRPWLRKFWCL